MATWRLRDEDAGDVVASDTESVHFPPGATANITDRSRNPLDHAVCVRYRPARLGLYRLRLRGLHNILQINPASAKVSRASTEPPMQMSNLIVRRDDAHLAAQ